MYTNIKEFNVGHGARKHDHFARPVFVSIQAVNSIFKKRVFFKKVSIFEKEKGFIIRKKVFLRWQIQILELKKKEKVFSSPISDLKCGKSLHSSQASLDFPQLEETLLSLWLISLHAQDGALFQPPNRRHTVEEGGMSN